MAKTKKPKKHYPTDIPLMENVRILKCGAWGYIYQYKAILKSEDVGLINDFAQWANINKGDSVGHFCILDEADRLQKLWSEPKILPQCFDSPKWGGDGHNYESQIKAPKG